MKKKKAILLLLIFFMNITVTTFTSIVNVKAEGTTKNDIRTILGSETLLKDSNGKPTILTEVNMTFNGKPINQTNPITWGDKFQIDYHIDIPNELSQNIQSGDYFTFSLVDSSVGIKVLTENMSGDLRDPDNDIIYGTYQIDKMGIVTFIFNDNASKYNDLSGVFQCSFELDKETITETGPHEITIPVTSSTENEIIYVHTGWNLGITKQLVNQTDESGITTAQWRIVINPDRLVIENPLITEFATVKKNPYEPGKYDGKHVSSNYEIDKLVKAKTGDNFGAPNYSVTELDEIEPKPTFDKDGNLKLPSPLTETYVLYVSTPFFEDAFGEIINNVTLSGSNISAFNASASITLDSKGLLNKIGTGYDKETQRISWTIKYNTNKKNISENNAFFEDELDNFLTFLPNTIKVEPAVEYEITETDKGFKFNFKQDIDREIIITYQSEIKQGEINKHEIAKNKIFNTNESIEANQELGEPDEPIKPELPVSKISKKVEKPVAGDNTLTWVMVLNEENIEVDSWEITDTLNFNEGNIITSSVKLIDETDGLEVPKTEYTIKFLNNNHQFILTYPNKTNHTFKVEYESSPLIAERWQRNNVIYKYYIGEHEGESESNAEYYHPKINNISLSKSGSFVTGYNQVEWIVGVNTKYVMTNAEGKLVDPIPNGQTYVPGSAKVVRAYKNQTVGKEIATEAPVIFNSEKNQLEVNLPSKKDIQYQLIFRTVVEDNNEVLEGKVKNIAYYSDLGVSNKKVEASLQADKDSNPFVVKSGSILTNNPNRLLWKIRLNPDKFQLKNVEILDNNWLNQKIIPDSVKITQVTGLENGKNLTEGIDYEFDYTEREFSIKFKDEINEEYVISYLADVIYPNDSIVGKPIPVRNGVKIIGSNIKIEDGDYYVEKPVVRPDSSGIISGKVRSFRIKKLDEDTGKVLSGASFILYRGSEKDKTKIVDRQTTNSNGEILFTNLTIGDYLLVESEAPSGYNIDEELKKGVIIKINSEDANLLEKVYTNSDTPRKDISVEKKWVGISEEDAPSVIVHLQANDLIIKSLELNSKNNYKNSFLNLPKYDETGKKITYTISEKNIPYYESEIIKKNEENFTIINTKIDTLNILGDKIWHDYNNEYETRPDEINIVLYQNETEYRRLLVSEGEDERWNYAFNDLPKLDEAGELFVYTVKEEMKDSHKNLYKVLYDEYDVINTYVRSGIVSVSGEKIWEDYGNLFETRPDGIKIILFKNNERFLEQTIKDNTSNLWKYSFEDLPKYDEVTGKENVFTVKEEEVNVGELDKYKNEMMSNNIFLNTYENDEKIDVKGEKKWVGDESNLSGRPPFIIIELQGNNEKLLEVKVSEDSNWKYEFLNLSKYDNQGKQIDYRITEKTIIDDYDSIVDGFDVINTYTKVDEETEIRGEKIWKDNDNQDGKRPDEVQIVLLADNREVTEKTVQSKDKWLYEFTGLPKYADGKEITYTLRENKILNYQVGYQRKGTSINIINTYTPQKTSIEVNKVWDDDNDRDNKRPDTIKVELFANGEETGYILELSKKNDWRDIFIDLDEYFNGKKVEYTIKESLEDGYSNNIYGSSDVGFTIVNRLEIETINIEGQKSWSDSDDKENRRPDTITINLYGNEHKIKSQIVKKDSDWKYSFKNLAKFDNGQEINYKIQEEHTEDYSSKINNYDLTNYLTNGYMNINVIKVWRDNNNEENKRVDSVQFNLLANGELTGQQLILAENNQWQGEFEELPMFENNQNIDYTIEEVKIDGYTSEIIKSSNNNFIVINTKIITNLEKNIDGSKKNNIGRLPKTNEIVTNDYILIILILLLLIIIYYSRKPKRYNKDSMSNDVDE